MWKIYFFSIERRFRINIQISSTVLRRIIAMSATAQSLPSLSDKVFRHNIFKALKVNTGQWAISFGFAQLQRNHEWMRRTRPFDLRQIYILHCECRDIHFSLSLDKVSISLLLNIYAKCVQKHSTDPPLLSNKILRSVIAKSTIPR